MKTLVLCLACLLLPGVALAAPVTIRSGEHDGFTRLVFDLPTGTTWSLEEAEGSATIITTPPAPFDLSVVFDRIRRDRFGDIRAGAKAGQVQLDIRCPCDLRTSVQAGNRVIIDLTDRPDQQGETREESPSPGIAPASSTTMAAARRLTQDLTRPFGADAESAITRQQRLVEVEDEILQQVARATTQGLLIPSLTPPVLPSDTPEPATKEAPMPPTPMVHPPSAMAHTSLSRSDGHGEKLTANGATCLPDATFDLATWAGDEGFALGLGRHRASLAEEFDRIPPDRLRALAQFYIAHGFGAEAKATLADLPAPGPDDAILLSLARIVDTGHDMRGSPLSGQADCDTAAALWSTLATDALPSATRPNGPAVLRTLNALPQPLRDHVGVLLAERLLSADQTELSKSVLRVVKRADTDPDDRQPLVEGRIALDEGDVEAGRATLASAASQDREPSPEALIALVEHDLAQARPVPAETAELIGAYVFQYRTAPIAKDLRRVEILARASAGQFDPAFRLLEEADRRDLIGDAGPAVRNRVIDALVATADDATFLRLGLQQADHHGKDLDPKTALPLGTRFLDLGFPDVATQVLTTQDTMETEPYRLVLARAALSAGFPVRAEATLSGLGGKEATALTARARARAGNHAAAAETYATVSMVAESDRQSWLSGDWPRLTATEDALIASAARLMTSDPITDQQMERAEPNASEEGVLARNRQLLKESDDARETLAALLSRFPVSANTN